MNHQKPIRFIRLPELLHLSGRSKTTNQNLIKQGLMPPSISLGDRSIGFIESEVNQVLAAMAAGKSQEEIKALVAYLVENRHRYAEALEVM